VQNLVAGRDFAIPESSQVSVVEVIEGDKAADGSGELTIQRGVEIGHIFALGDKYTKAFGVKIPNKEGALKTPTMGSYGIGITRVVALLAEIYHDDAGLAWPSAVAPADVHIVVAAKEESAYANAQAFADLLAAKGVEVFLDDRTQVSFGVKIKDAGLLGVPHVVVFGRGLANDVPTVEIMARNGENKVEIALEDAEKEIVNRVRMQVE
jgi:prolyl-tRNA synthetase